MMFSWALLAATAFVPGSAAAFSARPQSPPKAAPAPVVVPAKTARRRARKAAAVQAARDFLDDVIAESEATSPGFAARVDAALSRRKASPENPK